MAPEDKTEVQKTKSPKKAPAASSEGSVATASQQTEARGKARVIKGVVTSASMNKTRVIEIKRSIRHGLYHKTLTRTQRLFIHDEKNESKVGDTVLAISTRPLSRHKSHSLYKIVERRA